MVSKVLMQGGTTFLFGALVGSFSVWGTRTVSKYSPLYKTPYMASGFGAVSAIAIDQGIKRSSLNNKEINSCLVDALVFMAGTFLVSGALVKSLGTRLLKRNISWFETTTYAFINIPGGLFGLMVQETNGRYEKKK